MTTSVLLDTQLVLFLVATHQLDTAAQVLGIDVSSFAYLPELSWQVKRAKWMREQWPGTRGPEVQRSLVRMRTVPAVGDRELLDALLEVDMLDDGEALLLAAIDAEPGDQMCTPDVRALRTLASARTHAVAALRERIRGRVIYDISLVAGIAHIRGVESVRRAWLATGAQSKTLDCLFGTSGMGNEASFWAGVRSYEDELDAVFGGGFLNFVWRS